ncbi:hypothetical protein BH09BAC1_BH09BAC1_08270 [soil metagenome]
MFTEKPFQHSTYREHLVEHIFLANLLSAAYEAGYGEIEVARAEADIAGYDLILSYKHIVRFVQLKSRTKHGKAREFPVNKKLEQKENGCVLLLLIDEKNIRNLSYCFCELLEMRDDSWEKVNKRKHTYYIPIRDFSKIDNETHLLDVLFGVKMRQAEEMLARALLAEEDIKAGRVYTIDEAKERIKKRIENFK